MLSIPISNKMLSIPISNKMLSIPISKYQLLNLLNLDKKYLNNTYTNPNHKIKSKINNIKLNIIKLMKIKPINS